MLRAALPRQLRGAGRRPARGRVQRDVAGGGRRQQQRRRRPGAAAAVAGHDRAAAGRARPAAAAFAGARQDQFARGGRRLAVRLLPMQTLLARRPLPAQVQQRLQRGAARRQVVQCHPRQRHQPPHSREFCSFNFYVPEFGQKIARKVSCFTS